MKVIIVDDEQLAREELRYLLSTHEEIVIAGEAGNVESAEKLINETQPDCILLDIDMPGGDGFSLLDRLEHFPPIIFTTAYSEFALKAFDVGAYDYLVKPIERRRLDAALAKLKYRPDHDIKENEGQALRLSIEDKVFIKDGDKCWLVKLHDIAFIESVGNYACFHFNENRPMIKKSLNYLEARLPEKSFIRVNRQSIVNIDSIKGVTTIEGGTVLLAVQLGNKTIEFEMSRRQVQKLSSVLSL